MDIDVNKRTVINNKDLDFYKREIGSLNKLQYAIKIIINSIYGAFGNKYFYFHNRDIAQSITKQGKHLILFSIAAVNNYFKNIWHNDKELHEKLGISHLKINTIASDSAIYADTDSVAGESEIVSNIGRMPFYELFDKVDINSIEYLSNGQIIIKPKNLKILNFKNNKLVMSPVKYLMKHKVKKKKWLLKTKSGKELYITNDHSCIVFRGGHKISVRPNQIKITDKILKVYLNK